MSMFCFQCEQRSQGVGCTAFGVCGKDPETASLQDLLIHACKEISQYAHQARPLGGVDHEIDLFVTESLFTTVTNVNFDPDNLVLWLDQAGKLKAKAIAMRDEVFAKAGQTPPALPPLKAWTPGSGRDQYVREGGEVGVEGRQEQLGEDISGLQELLLYGLKGMAAYADHAKVLGVEDDEVYGFIHEAMSAMTATQPTMDGCSGSCSGAVSQPEGHGYARQGEYRDLRPSQADPGAGHSDQGQGCSRLGHDLEDRPVAADRGDRHQCLHAW